MIEIDNIDHIGIRVADRDRAIKFYNLFGFKSVRAADNDDVIVMKNDNNVEINIIFNANNNNNNNNILMDETEKFPGFTHVAFRVDSIKSTIENLNKNKASRSQSQENLNKTYVL